MVKVLSKCVMLLMTKRKHKERQTMNYLNWILLFVNLVCGMAAIVLHLNHASFATTVSIVLIIGMTFKIAENLRAPIKFDRTES